MHTPMMTYKQALLLVLRPPFSNSRILQKSFLVAAFGAAIFVFGLYHSAFAMGLPWWVLKQQGLPSELLWEVLPWDVVGIVATLVGLVAMCLGLWWSHRQALKTVEVLSLKARHYPPVSPEQRLSRLTIAAAISLLLLTLLSLPQVIVGLGFYQTAVSTLMLDEANVPTWVYLVQAGFSFVGMLIILFTALYFRLVFFSRKS